MNDSSTGGALLSYIDEYITPPLDGKALEQFIQTQITAITGIPGNLIRPRWQPNPPPLPGEDVDWLAFNLENRKTEGNAYVYHETPHLDEATGLYTLDGGQTIDSNVVLDTSASTGLGRTLDDVGAETQFLDTKQTLDSGASADQEKPNTLDAPSFDIVMRNQTFTAMCSFYGPNADTNVELLRDGLFVPQNTELLTAQGIAFVGADDITPMPSLVNNVWYYRVDLPLTFRRTIRRVYAVLDITSAQLSLTSGALARPITVTSK